MLHLHHFSAALYATSMTSVRPSVYLSVTLVDCDHKKLKSPWMTFVYLHAEADADLTDYYPAIPNSTDEDQYGAEKTWSWALRRQQSNGLHVTLSQHLYWDSCCAIRPCLSVCA